MCQILGTLNAYVVSILKRLYVNRCLFNKRWKLKHLLSFKDRANKLKDIPLVTQPYYRVKTSPTFLYSIEWKVQAYRVLSGPYTHSVSRNLPTEKSWHRIPCKGRIDESSGHWHPRLLDPNGSPLILYRIPYLVAHTFLCHIRRRALVKSSSSWVSTPTWSSQRSLPVLTTRSFYYQPFSAFQS